jgi:ferredoxin--NADP+ reductase
VIGSNKQCAAETVGCLLEDARAGKLLRSNTVTGAKTLAVRQEQVVSFRGWQCIDRAERQAGRARGRPRIKQTEIGELLASSEGPRSMMVEVTPTTPPELLAAK